MSFKAEVIAHSVGPTSATPPLFTMRLRYPRFIHAEELTHRILNTSPEQIETWSIPDGLMYDRDLSRNASSSRAIPVSRLVEDIRMDPAEPLFWGKNKTGMQAAEEMDNGAKQLAQAIWRRNREDCIRDALELSVIGAHKQLVNRLVENHGHINVVVTATNWSNFFALRRHAAAMPEIRHLADLIWESQQASTPRVLDLSDWHLPFISQDDMLEVAGSAMWPTLIKLSVARCARVSYLTHEGRKPVIQEDLALYERLAGSVPLHASPAEHQARPDYWSEPEGVGHRGWARPHQHGNLTGWVQFRKTLPHECA
jgi:hypothetical protein